MEDDPLQAETVASVISVSNSHRSVGIADDLNSALAVAERTNIDLALVDINLKRNATGYNVAAELGARGIPSAFLTETAPPFDVPEIAVGCLTKPYSADELIDFVTAIARCLTDGQAGHQPLSRNARIYRMEANPPRSDPPGPMPGDAAAGHG